MACVMPSTRACHSSKLLPAQTRVLIRIWAVHWQASKLSTGDCVRDRGGSSAYNYTAQKTAEHRASSMQDTAMANFRTHLSVAAALSGCLATGFLEVGIAAPKDVWLYFAMGTLGG